MHFAFLPAREIGDANILCVHRAVIFVQILTLSPQLCLRQISNIVPLDIGP